MFWMAFQGDRILFIIGKHAMPFGFILILARRPPELSVKTLKIGIHRKNVKYPSQPFEMVPSLVSLLSSEDAACPASFL